jgi:hypothetical protein
MIEDITLQIQEVEKKIDDFSKLIGEKIRIGQEQDTQDSEFNELKEKLQGEDPKNKKNPKDKKNSKEKKKKKSKQKNDKWFDLDGVQIYNEMGLKGELELYFNANELLKEHLENLRKIKKTVDSIIDKGLKNDMGCITFQGLNMPYQIAFHKSDIQRKKFSFKSTIEAMSEVMGPPKIS